MNLNRFSFLFICLICAACAAPSELHAHTETQDSGSRRALPPTWTLTPTPTGTSTPAATATIPPTITPTATLPNEIAEPILVPFEGAAQWWLRIPNASLIHASGVSDGGLLVILQKSEAKSSRVYTALRLTSDGLKVWGQTIQGILFPTGILETADGGVLITEYTRVHKLDGLGEWQWSKGYSFGEGGFNMQLFSPILEIRPQGQITTVIGWFGDITTLDRDGEPVEAYMAARMSGALGSDEYVSAPSLDGEYFAEQESRTVYRITRRTNRASAWELRFDFIPFDVTLFPPHFIRSTRDGGAIFLAPAPNLMADGGFAIFAARLDRTGDVLWQHIYYGVYENDFYAVETEDGGFLITNTRQFFGHDYSGFYLRMTRLDPDGFILWDRLYGDGETQIQVQQIIEKPEGGFILIGQHGFGGENDVPAGISLLSVDSQGTIPGCKYLAETAKPEILGRNPDVRIAPKTPGVIYQGDLSAYELDELQLSITPSETRIEALCFYPLPESFAEKDPEEAAERVHAFVNQDGLLLGGVQGDTWFAADEVVPQISQNPSFRFYNLTSYLGEADVRLIAPPDYSDCPEQAHVEILSEKLPAHRIGLDADWNAVPRLPADLSSGIAPYTEIVKDLLAKNGIKGVPAAIDGIVKVDLDGDGTEEVLISANRNSTRLSSEGVTEGDYSLFLLRRLGSTGVETYKLYERYITQDSQFGQGAEIRLIGAYDLDGDGTMEILLQETGWKASRYFVFDPDHDPLQPVLTTRCGE